MPRRRPGTRLMGLLMVAAGVGALLFTVAREGPPPGAKPVAYANGILTTSTSGDGAAILSATGFAPGHTAHGQVIVANDSSDGGAVSIAQRLRSETAGIGGGRLYDGLLLTIRQTDGSQDGLVYTGPISVMGSTPLTDFAPGERRTYSFDATFPDRGDPGGPTSGDNALQGSSLSVDFIWSANSVAPPGGPPAPPNIGKRGCRHGVLGSGGPDALAANGGGLRVLGKAGDDRINGSRSTDCLYGGIGNDRLWGYAGADRIRGGYGDDVLRGGPGDDRIRGRQGDDVVIGGAGRDRLRGTSGDDRIYAVDGTPDRIKCGIGHDLAVIDPVDQVSGCEQIAFR